MDCTGLEQNIRYVFYGLTGGLFIYVFVLLPYSYKLGYRGVNSVGPHYIVRLFSIFLGIPLTMFIVIYFGSDIFEGYVTWVSNLFHSHINNIAEAQEMYRSVVLLIYTVMLLPIAVNVFSMAVISTFFRFGIGIHRHLGASTIFHIIHLIIVPILLVFIFKIVGFELLMNASSILQGVLELFEEIIPVLQNLEQFESNGSQCL